MSIASASLTILRRARLSAALAVLAALMLASLPAWPAARAAVPAATRSLTITCTFEGSDTATALPVPWTRGGNARAAEIGLDGNAHEGRRALRVNMPDSAGFAAAVCTVPDSLRAGRTVARLSGWVRTDRVGHAGLWMRVTGTREVLASRDLSTGGLAGTHGWTRQEILLPVPRSTARLTFGLVARGGGTAWTDDLMLELFAPADAPPPSPAARTYVEAVFDSLRRHALRSSETNWTALRENVFERIPAARTSADTWEALGWAAQRLDPPTRLLTPHEVRLEDTLALSAPARREAWPFFDRLDGWCGLIVLTGLPGTDAEARSTYVGQVHHMLTRFDSVGVCGYILDLRHADGAHPEAMLAAIAPFLGDGPLGGEIRPDSSRVQWSYAHGTFTRTRRGRTLSSAVTNELPRFAHPNAPVAILTGPGTFDAGEAVLAAFRGRPLTCVFGRASAGAARGVERVRMRDGSVLEVADSRYVDRQGVAFTAGAPDSLDDGSPPRPGYRENVIESALHWIQAQPGCAAK